MRAWLLPLLLRWFAWSAAARNADEATAAGCSMLPHLCVLWHMGPEVRLPALKHSLPGTRHRADAPTHRRTDAPTHRRTDAPTVLYLSDTMCMPEVDVALTRSAHSQRSNVVFVVAQRRAVAAASAEAESQWSSADVQSRICLSRRKQS